MFNNREIATGIWLSILIGYALRRREVRSTIASLVRTLLLPKVLLVLATLATYAGLVVLGLHAIGIWTPRMLKDTVLWFVLTAMPFATDYMRNKPQDSVFRKVWRDNIRGVMVVEFLANTYTFSLLGEIVLVPVTALLGGMGALSATDERYVSVRRVTDLLQGMVGLTILLTAALRALRDYQQFASFDAVMSMVLPPLLSIALSPIVYLLALIANYELLFLNLELGTQTDPALRRYGKLLLVRYCGLSVARTQELLADSARDLRRARTREDLHIAIQRHKRARGPQPTGRVEGR